MAIVFLSYIFFKYFCDFLERFVALGLDSIVKQSSSSRKKKKKTSKTQRGANECIEWEGWGGDPIFLFISFFFASFFPFETCRCAVSRDRPLKRREGLSKWGWGGQDLVSSDVASKKKSQLIYSGHPHSHTRCRNRMNHKKKVHHYDIGGHNHDKNRNRKQQPKKKQTKSIPVRFFFLFSGGFGCRRHGNGGFFFFHSFAVDVGQSAHYAFMSSPSPSSSGAVLYYYSYLFFFCGLFWLFFFYFISLFFVCVCRYCGAAMKRGPVRRWPLSSSNIPSTAIRASSATDFDGPR